MFVTGVRNGLARSQDAKNDTRTTAPTSTKKHVRRQRV